MKRRRWFQDRPAEVPESTADRWSTLIRRQRTLEFGDLARLAAAHVRMSVTADRRRTLQVQANVISGFELWDERAPGQRRFLWPKWVKLSLDYFGSKRTGDLMARIGSETDRISVFLSLHALDFATDVLMIAMTSIILFSINPWLALVTLLPLPFIAWMIHVVRDRLRTGFEKIDRVWGDVTNVLADTIPGIRVVKAFAQEGREARRFREANKLNLQVNDRLNKTWSLFSPTVSLLTDIGLLVGFGSVFGSGCTSGQGVCGISRLSWRSIAATLIFMAAAVLTVFVSRHIVGL